MLLYTLPNWQTCQNQSLLLIPSQKIVTSVSVSLLGSGLDHQLVEFFNSSLMIHREILETTPDVLVRQGDNFRLPLPINLGDRLEQWLGRQGDPLVANALPLGTKFVTKTFSISALLIMISPRWHVGLIVDSVTNDRPRLQKGFSDLLVDRVVWKEPAADTRLLAGQTHL